MKLNKEQQNSILGSSYSTYRALIAYLANRKASSSVSPLDRSQTVAVSVYDDQIDSHQPLLRKIYQDNVQGMSDVNRLWTDRYLFWGAKFGRIDRLAARAMQNNAPAWFVEDSYIRSVVGSLVNEKKEYSLSCSLTFDDLAPHYDGNYPTRIEQIIQAQKPMEAAETADIRRTIDFIIDTRLTKYNDQPIMDDICIGAREKKVLIILQSYGDASVEITGGDTAVFEKMLSDAVKENPDADILIKTHPDTIIKSNRSYIDDRSDKLHFLNFRINPISLLRYVDKVYVYSSQMGFEALLLGKEVKIYGNPWYAGWGLTDDVRPIARRIDHSKTIEQLFKAFYLDYSHYFDADGGEISLEKASETILSLRTQFFDEKYRAKNVLVIKLDGIGDYILARDPMRTLKHSEYFKNAKFSLLGDSGYRGVPEALDGDFFSDFKWVNRRSNRLMNWLEEQRQDARGIRRRIFEVLSFSYLVYSMGLRTGIRRSDYDCIIVCCWNRRLRNTILMFLKWMKPKYTVGLATMDFKKSRYSISVPISGDHLKYFRNDLEQAFFSALAPAQKTMPSPPQSKTSSVVMVVGAFHAKRRWPIERYLEVASWLSKEHGLTVTVIGESELPKLPKDVAEDKNITISLGRLPIERVVSLVSSSSLVISNDTGFYHLAVALHKPTVVISNGNSYSTFLHYPETHPDASNIREVLVPDFEKMLRTKNIDKVRAFTRSSDLDIAAVTVEKVKAAVLDVMKV